MNKPSILHSIKWNYFGALLKGLSQLAVLGVLARLLSPEEFGLMALALVAIKFGSYFSDFGLAAAIQQKKEIHDSDIQTSFWFSVIAGLLLFLITLTLAEPLAFFFDTPELSPVIKLVALSFLLIGASATSLGLLKRRMQFKYLSIMETTIYLVSNGIIGIMLAYYGYGVYSLAIAYLSQLLFTLLGAYLKTRHSIKINLNIADYKHVLNFGGGYSIASFMTFIGSNIDHILIGKFFPAAELGLWNRSRNIIFMPTYSLLVSITGVLLPAYSKHQHDNQRFSELYLKSLTMTGFILIPIGGGMFSAAPQLVEVLLGSNWRTAVPLVQLSALFVPVELLASVAATACSALGALSSQIRLQTILLFIFVPIMLFFAVQHQLDFILISLAAYYWLRFFIYIFVISNKLKIKLTTQLEIIASQLIGSAWVSALIYLASHHFSHINGFKLLPIEIAIGGAGLAAFLLFGPAKNCRKIIYNFLQHRQTDNKLIVFGTYIFRKGC